MTNIHLFLVISQYPNLVYRGPIFTGARFFSKGQGHKHYCFYGWYDFAPCIACILNPCAQLLLDMYSQTASFRQYRSILYTHSIPRVFSLTQTHFILFMVDMCKALTFITRLHCTLSTLAKRWILLVHSFVFFPLVYRISLLWSGFLFFQPTYTYACVP